MESSISVFRRSVALLLPALAYLPLAYASGLAASEPSRISDRHPLLFVAVYSAPGRKAAAQRTEIRDTYWRHPLLQHGGPIVARFVVGHAKQNTTEAEALDAEMKAYPNDFLRLDIDEDYNLLTVKTMSLFQWFAKSSRARWLLKLDDDTFPHLEAIMTRLVQETAPNLELGMLFGCAPVLNHTKWAEDPKVYNHSHYPKYMQGSGYFLTADLVREIAVKRYEQNSKYILHNEDAAVGNWIEMQKRDDPSWPIELKEIQASISGCKPGDLLSMNNQPGYMRCYWGRKLRGEQDICCNGPLNHLKQSFLQRSMLTRRHMVRDKVKAKGAGCYPRLSLIHI